MNKNILIFGILIILIPLVSAVEVTPTTIYLNISAGDMETVPISIIMSETKPQHLYIESDSPYCLFNGSENVSLTITQELTIVNLTVWTPADSTIGMHNDYCHIKYNFLDLGTSGGSGGSGGGGGGGCYYKCNQTTTTECISNCSTQCPTQNETENQPGTCEQENDGIKSELLNLLLIIIIIIISLLLVMIIKKIVGNMKKEK